MVRLSGLSRRFVNRKQRGGDKGSARNCLRKKQSDDDNQRLFVALLSVR